VKQKTQTQIPESSLSTGLRRYLYFTAGVTGAAVMIVEILGAKMLSPYLGTSHFVWTAQIAITLVALACGYYAGGRLVDKSLQLGRLYTGILIAGAYLALTVAISEPAAYAFLHLDLALGSLLTSALLFFVPLSLLAMVGPFLVRILTVSVNTVGGNVGRLTAISTFGSFVGTVLIGYLLIPFLRNSVTMCLTALLLMSIAGIYFLIWKRTLATAALTTLAIALGAAAGYIGLRHEGLRAQNLVELYRANSNFGMLQVVQQKDGPLRYYLNDYLYQNTYDTNAHQSISMFTYMLHGLAQAYTPHIDDVLCIGMGVGVVPMEFARDGARVDVVEINPAVVPLAEKFFDLQPKRLNISIGDGRYFVNRSAKQYDAVILDAFLGDSCPSHLMTREAFSAIRRDLKPEGTLVINTFGEFEAGQDFFAASLSKTLKNVFPSVRIHKGQYGNTLFVASINPKLEIVHPPKFEAVHSNCASQVRDAFATLRETHPGHGIVLTDDFNPVELYDAKNRENLRRYLADSMHEM